MWGTRRLTPPTSLYRNPSKLLANGTTSSRNMSTANSQNPRSSPTRLRHHRHANLSHRWSNPTAVLRNGGRPYHLDPRGQRLEQMFSTMKGMIPMIMPNTRDPGPVKKHPKQRKRRPPVVTMVRIRIRIRMHHLLQQSQREAIQGEPSSQA